MHLSLIRYVLISFLMAIVGFMLACLVVLSSLEQVAAQLERSDLLATLGVIQSTQLIVLILCLIGLLGGFIAMAFAVHQASRIVDRLRQAAIYLGDVVLDEMSPSDF